MFQLVHDFTHLASKWVFRCATSLDSEPMHFEILQILMKSFETLYKSLHESLFVKKLHDE